MLFSCAPFPKSDAVGGVFFPQIMTHLWKDLRPAIFFSAQANAEKAPSTMEDNLLLEPLSLAHSLIEISWRENKENI
jgi:hypothetical protein